MAIREDPPGGRGAPATPDATTPAGAPAAAGGPAAQGAAGPPGGPGPPGTPPAPPDPTAMLRSRAYVRLLVVAAILGVPISAAAWGFLALVSYLQKELFTHLPHGLGFATAPAWWPLPMLVIGGVLTALAIRYLPGNGGASPAGGFAVHPPPTPVQLPGVIWAALATLAFGAVIGPEMPLIALGSGLAVLATKAARRRQVPAQGVQGAGRRRELRGHQHAAGIAHHRRVLADGGVRAGRAHAGPGAAARAAGVRGGRAHLRRPGQPDRAGHVRAGHPPPAALRPARCGRVRLGDRDRAGRRADRPGHPPAVAVGAPLRREVGHDRAPAGRRGGRGAHDHLHGGDRQARVRRAVLGAERYGDRWSSTPPAIRWARCCCCWSARDSPTACR